jgi:Stigma-specific protein, Stig1
MAPRPLGLLGFVLAAAIAGCSSASIAEDGDAPGAGQAVQAGADANGAGASCTGGQTACGAECIDLRSSNDHCGACGAVCAGGTSCQKGFCTSEGSCAEGRLACGSKCVDARSDAENCGACGHACGDAGACVAGGCPGELRVRVLIDGQSQLVVQGKTVKWHVIRAAAPGRWDGHDDATMLNGAPWLPAWPAKGDNRDCNCDSQPSPPVAAGLRAIAQTVTLTKVAGRGGVTINEQPSTTNGFTLKVDFSDPPSGAAWYEIVLAYSAD